MSKNVAFDGTIHGPCPINRFHNKVRATYCVAHPPFRRRGCVTSKIDTHLKTPTLFASTQNTQESNCASSVYRWRDENGCEWYRESHFKCRGHTAWTARNDEGRDQLVSGTVRGWIVVCRCSSSGNAPSMAAMSLIKGGTYIRRPNI